MKKLVAACEKLGLNYQSEPEKSYPRFWWNNSGRILVEIDKTNKIPKEELMKTIAQRARAFKIKRKTSPPPKESKKSSESSTSPSTKYKTKKNVSAKRKKKGNT